MRRLSPALGFALAMRLAGTAHAGEHRPVAAMTIYPGDIIRDEMLADADLVDANANGAFATNRSMLVGKVAKRTLLPGAPIPTNAVGLPRLVTVGSMVRLVYTEGGLTISTYAAALQNGSAGDVVSVRNPESGIVVTGVVRADGTVQIGAS